MAIDYAKSSAAHKSGRRKVKIAQGKKQHARVIEVCDETLSAFEQFGYVDDWHFYTRAIDDAEFAIQRERNDW